MTAKIGTQSRVGLVFALFALGACGGSGSLDTPIGTKPYRPYMVGVPYQISGKWYNPKENLSYDRVGVASWYGKDFHGRRTANGETYDMNKMTAAHPTLPMPTIVRVTNLENNRSVLLRVNDRGPFAKNRIIDVSRRAAAKLGFMRAGTARVRVTVLRDRTIALKRRAGVVAVARVSTPKTGPDPMDPTHRDRFESGTVTVADKGPADDDEPAARRDDTRPAGGRSGPVDLRPRDLRAEERVPAPTVVAAPTDPATARRIFIQAGAYTERNRALRIGRKLKPLGRTSVSAVSVRETRFYRVRVGPVRTAAESDRVLARMVAMGYTGARIVVE